MLIILSVWLIKCLFFLSGEHKINTFSASFGSLQLFLIRSKRIKARINPCWLPHSPEIVNTSWTRTEDRVLKLSSTATCLLSHQDGEASRATDGSMGWTMPSQCTDEDFQFSEENLVHESGQNPHKEEVAVKAAHRGTRGDTALMSGGWAMRSVGTLDSVQKNLAWKKNHQQWRRLNNDFIYHCQNLTIS